MIFLFLSNTIPTHRFEFNQKRVSQEEMDLCEYLGNYLATTFLVEAKKEEEVAAAPIAEFNGSNR